jgi:hypothetical protein
MTTSPGKLSFAALVRAGGVAGLLVFVILLLLTDMSWWLALIVGVLVLAITVAGGRLQARRRAPTD